MAKKIPLQNGMFAIVDDEDYERVIQKNWIIHRNTDTTYVVFGYHDDNQKVRLSHFILKNEIPKGKLVSFKDRNPLNFRKDNLIFVSQGELNARRRAKRNGTSKYKGVHWDKNRKKWVTQISKNGKRFMKRFDHEEEAALFYNEKSQELYGDKGFINKIKKDNRSLKVDELRTDKNRRQRSHKERLGNFRGISKFKDRYIAQIWFEDKRIHLGYFDDAKSAAKAYDKKAYELYGDKAILNFPHLIKEYEKTK